MGCEELRGSKTHRDLGMGESQHSKLVRQTLILAPQSYGGFMSSKVVEAGAGIHSLAMAVAGSFLGFLARFLLIECMFTIQPVTSWRLYGKLMHMDGR